MPSLPPHLAEKLLQLCHGETIAASKMKHEIISNLVNEGIIIEYRQGRTKSSLQIPHPEQLADYLQNHFGIGDLEAYIETARQQEVNRSDLVIASSDSKMRQVRTFKGFMVNSYEPVEGSINDNPYIINPATGTFVFISDYESFIPAQGITIVGIENPENFSRIHLQQELFAGLRPLFVCRYPQNQSKDLLKWLQMIPNPYLHFGDFDFAGIGIYLNEYKTHLKNRASFFIPQNIEELINRYGNRERYDVQKVNFDRSVVDEDGLVNLMAALDKYKKGLDQEVMIRV
jgi:hypothetical protein